MGSKNPIIGLTHPVNSSRVELQALADLSLGPNTTKKKLDGSLAFSKFCIKSKNNSFATWTGSFINRKQYLERLNGLLRR
jgi:hypothetical protein